MVLAVGKIIKYLSRTKLHWTECIHLNLTQWSPERKSTAEKCASASPHNSSLIASNYTTKYKILCLKMWFSQLLFCTFSDLFTDKTLFAGPKISLFQTEHGLESHLVDITFCLSRKHLRKSAKECHRRSSSNKHNETMYYIEQWPTVGVW